MSYVTPIQVHVPIAYEGLWSNAAHKVMRGGRGAAKSWEVAEYLVCKSYAERHRILCAREFQTSMADSVHKLLIDTIERLGLKEYFRVTDTSIMAWTTGSEFIFKGLRRNIREIKSIEGISITWVEEAQSVSRSSWQILVPTVFRRPNAELIITYNPENEDDPVDELFWQKRHTYPEGEIWAAHINFIDNPHFPPELEKQRVYMEQNDPDAYEWVWNGGYRMVSDAQIFKKRYRVESFTAPVGARFHFGMDFGFANDPNSLIRSFIESDTLYIDYAQFGYNVELDDLPKMMDMVPGARDWPIKADSSRPETISFLRRKGFQIAPAKKWEGCIEDGIAHLKGFAGGIVIHERCKEMAQEARLYSFKIDPVTEDVLPIIVDKHNHGWDATRYALDGYILRRGAAGVWERLGGKQ